jgi:UDP-N-acetylglucosamine--N-acetylmuramyl-(pentapeptide) pyrophosphoryl-undecaprenol N-acetylglucosamine transferase
MPSPNVAEDHQTKNAMALVSQGAAMLIKDSEGKVKLGNEVAALLKDNDAMEKLSRSIRNLAKPRATSEIVDLIEEAVYGD